MARKEKWTTFGWLGVNFEVPESWNLGRVNGDRKKGYLRLDDEIFTRLELRWEKKRGVPDIEKIVARHVNELDHSAKRHKVSFEVKRNLGFFRLRDSRYHECFYWEGDYKVFNLIFKCEASQVTYLLRLFFKKTANMRVYAKRIFESFSDSPAGDDELWGFFGFQFCVPKGLVLEKTSLKAGCYEVLLADKASEIEVIRLSIAATLLKGRSLKDWFFEFYKKRLGRLDVRVAAARTGGHEGIEVVATPKGNRRVLPLFRSKTVLRARCWHCDEGDKLYIFRVTSREPQDARCERYAQKVRCH